MVRIYIRYDNGGNCFTWETVSDRLDWTAYPSMCKAKKAVRSHFGRRCMFEFVAVGLGSYA